jgi:hypothetical protein
MRDQQGLDGRDGRTDGQVALAAAIFARLWILDWTLVSNSQFSLCVVRWKCPPCQHGAAPHGRPCWHAVRRSTWKGIWVRFGCD